MAQVTLERLDLHIVPDLFPDGGMMAVWTLHSTTGQPDESQRSVDFGQLSCARCVQTQTQQEKLYAA